METPKAFETPLPSAGVGPGTGPAASRPRRRQRSAVAAVGGMLLVVTGCGSDSPDAAVTAAQAQVSAKEKSLADAESAAAAAADEFCGASATYITALDVYGDILTDTEPTVGDVKVGGQELTEPRDETIQAGQAAVSAQEELVQAEQELADAQVKLAEAEASAAGEDPPEPVEGGETVDEPLAAPATIERVQRAEADFATAQEGITDDTTLAKAGEQFNSAAVALEMSWLRLFAEVGCLTDEQQEEAAIAVSEYTATLQGALSEAGYYDGDVDGVYGPETVEAVEALQAANGLAQTGTVDKATEAALRSELAALGGVAAEQETASTAAVQQTLKLAGYWTGPVDGQWTDELTAALEEMQADLGVPVTGTVDSATIKAFEEALATAQESPSPSPSASQTTGDEEPAESSPATEG